MRTVQSARASQELGPFVRGFAQRGATGSFNDQLMPPFLETLLHFDFGDLPTVVTKGRGIELARRHGIVGPHTSPGIQLGFDGTIESFAIFLDPGALWSLFRIPVSEVIDSHYDIADVLGSPFERLWQMLAEAADFDERVRLAETFLLGHSFQDRSGTAMTSGASLLAHPNGPPSIGALASHMQLSVRQLERSFLREMGTSPKRFARIARFEGALDARVHSPRRSWLDIASSSGYHDQMHMIHDFEALGGISPSLMLAQLGDSRPSAIAAANSAHEN